MNDLQQQLDALRRDLDDLRGKLQPSPAGVSPDAANHVSDAIKQHLQDELDKNSKSWGISVGAIVAQLGPQTFSMAINNVTLTDESNLPSDEKIVEQVERLARYVQDPRLLRALRYLLAPFFEGKPKQRTMAELAAALGVSPAEVEQIVRPVVEDKEMRWSKNADGEEFYEWSGNGLPMAMMVLPLH
jgi:hypothetical protein